jgi:cyanate permease
LIWIAISISIIFNTFVNPIALEAIGWKYYIVFLACLTMYGIIIWFFYPETRGYSLEQIAIIFDGEDGAVKIEKEELEKIQTVRTVHVDKA